MKKKKNDCCLISDNVSLVNSCGDIIPEAEYKFENAICYRNGEKFGSIISTNKNEKFNQYFVKVSNGNKYMEGQSIEFNILIK